VTEHRVGAIAVQMTRHETGLWRATCPYHKPSALSLTMATGGDEFGCTICLTTGTVLRVSHDGRERALVIIIADKDRQP
jgi:hypothetical protein